MSNKPFPSPFQGAEWSDIVEIVAIVALALAAHGSDFERHAELMASFALLQIPIIFQACFGTRNKGLAVPGAFLLIYSCIAAWLTFLRLGASGAPWLAISSLGLTLVSLIRALTAPKTRSVTARIAIFGGIAGLLLAPPQ